MVQDSTKKEVFLRFMKNLLLKPHHYTLKQGSEQKGLLFFYSADYYRQDHLRNFLTAASCAPWAATMAGENRDMSFKNISLPAFFKRLAKIPALKQYHQAQWSTKEGFWRLLPFYLILEDQWEFLSNTDLTDYTKLVVYYDGWFTDAALVQLFKHMGKKTATLQHAFFAAQTEKSAVIGEKGVELDCSSADYFLAWNEATVMEAKKQGVDVGKFHVLGIPRYIGQSTEDCSFEANANTKTFGVVLGVKDNEKQNIRMIELANEIAKTHGLRYLLKYHPAFSGTEYDAWVQKEYYAGNAEKGMTLKEYVQCVDFSIAGNSTVMMELLYLKHRTFHYTDPDLYEKYTQMQEITFSDFAEFEQAYQTSSDVLETVRLRYCGPSDAKQQYCDFFSRF